MQAWDCRCGTRNAVTLGTCRRCGQPQVTGRPVIPTPPQPQPHHLHVQMPAADPVERKAAAVWLWVGIVVVGLLAMGAFDGTLAAEKEGRQLTMLLAFFFLLGAAAALTFLILGLRRIYLAPHRANPADLARYSGYFSARTAVALVLYAILALGWHAAQERQRAANQYVSPTPYPPGYYGGYR